jgi:hypothetical protein
MHGQVTAVDGTTATVALAHGLTVETGTSGRVSFPQTIAGAEREINTARLEVTAIEGQTARCRVTDTSATNPPGPGHRVSFDSVHRLRTEGTLVVEVSPVGAVVAVDKRPVGQAPVRLSLAPKSYRVSAAAGGFVTDSRQVDVPHDGFEILRFSLEASGQERAAGLHAGTYACDCPNTDSAHESITLATDGTVAWYRTKGIGSGWLMTGIMDGSYTVEEARMIVRLDDEPTPFLFQVRSPSVFEEGYQGGGNRYVLEE